jgi:hypothetical protein
MLRNKILKKSLKKEKKMTWVNPINQSKLYLSYEIKITVKKKIKINYKI